MERVVYGMHFKALGHWRFVERELSALATMIVVLKRRLCNDYGSWYVDQRLRQDCRRTIDT